MCRYKITIEYDGTNYSGWQKQKNAKSIQEEIEKALENFSQEKVRVHGMGRTDAGVHALMQVAHFDLEKDWEADVTQKAINYYLKDQDIVILSCEKVNDDFHARYAAKKRIYKYIVLNRFAPTALEVNKVWHVNQKLDLDKMRSATKILIGTHDFTSFRTILCQAKSPIKTLEYINILEDGEKIIFELCAPSFLHHMVRNIVGAICRVGLNQFSENDLKNYLDSKDINVTKYTVPACGLYFVKAIY